MEDIFCFAVMIMTHEQQISSFVYKIYKNIKRFTLNNTKIVYKQLTTARKKNLGKLLKAKGSSWFLFQRLQLSAL